ncbi:copper-binding protein [Streptomyces sp. NPDC096339]|uniref:copper-binding protein n=1 Tax=Streptomyces sp. NPDC096339 TaxID=3366086 RepID=UPI0037F699C3
MTTTSTRVRVVRALAAGAVAGVLAGCGAGGSGGSSAGGAPPPAPERPASGAGGTRVTADLTDFRIALSQKTFAPGSYVFVAKNDGHHDHALEIEGPSGENRTKTLAPGASDTIGVTLKPGTYEVYCPVDGHEDLGMKTEITVGAAATRPPVNPAPAPAPPSDGGGGY